MTQQPRMGQELPIIEALRSLRHIKVGKTPLDE